MIQLYRDGEYWQIWDRNGTIISHRGSVGQRGVLTEQGPLPSETIADGVRRETDLAGNQGFTPIPAERLAKVLVHYRFQEWPADEVASFAEVLKGLIGDTLGWTGNGVYDGFSVGPQELTLWYLTVNPDLAVKAILDVLGSHRYLQDAETQASLAVERGGNVFFAYPPERQGERFM
jgi:hypothetical protein